jgi:decaprenylphospho-beta-D-erythro-pentofuranosid-2-ulose 2-reductase
LNDAFGMPQSVVVLGGTSDIALAVIDQLGLSGCVRAVLAGRDAARLEQARQRTLMAGIPDVSTVEMDATAVDTAGAVVDQCFEAAGTDADVDMVLVAVGVLGDQEHDEHDPTRVAEVATVNYTWPAAALTRVADRLREQGHGRIVTLSTVAGVRVRRANYVYGSSKAGLDAFCIGLAEACRDTGVTVQVVRPGFVRTKMTEGRPAAPFATTPQAVATAVVRALTTNEPIVYVPALLRWVFMVFRQLPQSIWRRLPG